MPGGGSNSTIYDVRMDEFQAICSEYTIHTIVTNTLSNGMKPLKSASGPCRINDMSYIWSVYRTGDLSG